MVPNNDFEIFVKSWFSDNNQDFANDVLDKHDIHSEWLIALWNAYTYLNYHSK